jgi:WD40 repeat protein
MIVKQAWNAVTGAEVEPLEKDFKPNTRAQGRWPGSSFARWDGRVRIAIEDTTPRLFHDLAEGVFKISYHNFPNRLTIKFWDQEKDKKLSSVSLWSSGVLPDGRHFNDDVFTCAFSPDGRNAATILMKRNRSVHIWDMKSGRLKRRLNNRNCRITACGFSPDGQLVVTAGFDDRKDNWRLNVWDIHNGHCIQTFHGHAGGYKDEVEFCEYSPDGQRIISGGKAQQLLLWDATGKMAQLSLPSHSAQVTGCEFSTDGQWLVSAGGKLLYIRDAVSGEVLQQWIHPQKLGKKTLQDCSVSADRHWIATTVKAEKPLNPYESWTHTCIWDTASGRRVHNLKSSKSLPVIHTSFGRPEKPTRHIIRNCGGFHPNSQTLITVGYGDYEDNVVIWEAGSSHPLRTLAGYIPGQVEALRHSRDGRWIGAAYNSPIKGKQYEYFGNVGIWDATTGANLMTVSLDDGKICSFGFSPDGSRIVSGSEDGRLLVWDRGGGRAAMMLQAHKGIVHFCSFTPDGKLIVSAGLDRIIRVWNLAGKPIAVMPFSQDVLAGDMHPMQRVFALGDNTGFLHIFELIGID